MSTTTATHTAAEPAAERVDINACACHLYDAECALHAAHQSGVDDWIAKAAERLHEAVVVYQAALRDDERARAQGAA